MFLPKEKQPFPALVWFYLPWLFAIALCLVHFFHGMVGLSAANYYTYFYSENNLALIETLQTILLFVCVIVAGNIFFRQRGLSPWLCAWAGIATIGSLYVFLEEISYGQHVFGWHASEFWKEVNDQHETNLHNTSSWLDQKPRLLLEIGVTVGGIIIPLLNRYKSNLLPKRFSIIYPAGFLFWTAVLGQYAHFTEEMGDLVEMGLLEKKHYVFPLHAFGRESEVQETFYYYFIMLYLIDLRRRLKSR